MASVRAQSRVETVEKPTLSLARLKSYTTIVYNTKVKSGDAPEGQEFIKESEPKIPQSGGHPFHLQPFPMLLLHEIIFV